MRETLPAGRESAKSVGRVLRGHCIATINVVDESGR